MTYKYINSIDNIPQLSPEEKTELKKVTDKFEFLSNDYYLSLVNFDDPNDPIRRIIIPHTDELSNWGSLDASHEDIYTKVPGLQHKYRETALLLVSDACGGLCRFCFRKRIFIGDGNEIERDITDGLNYIREHPEITNVLLTGGDALMMSTKRLEEIIRQIREIRHVKIIRIGTRLPAFYPYRIIEDPGLIDMIHQYSLSDRRIYFMTHFNHPREITDIAIQAMYMLRSSGAVTVNQTPIIRGVNDDSNTMAELFKKLSYIGVPPYYIFQCRPVVGNENYAVPVEEAYHVIEEAKGMVSGLAKRARFTMSHMSGKLEVIAVADGMIHFKYHQAADVRDIGRVLSFKSNPRAYWLDDYRSQDSLKKAN